jgi:hypothetical protein
MIQEIKELRVNIDGLAQLTKELKPIKKKIKNNDNSLSKEPLEDFILLENSKEIEKAVDSLYLAKAWLGKVLGELENKNPYGSGYKTKEDIQPTADKYIIGCDSYEEDFNSTWKEKSHIEKVDWLRTEIEKVVNQIKEQLHFVESERMLLLERVEQYLSESRFWLGFELERIKNEK